MSFLCPRSSVVEHFLGKEEVIGSIPIVGFGFLLKLGGVMFNWCGLKTGGLVAL